jgi:hypothetical protein
MATERLVDVLNDKQNVLHTFPVTVKDEAAAPPEEKFHEKALSAAAHAQLVPTEELETLSTRMHVGRGGPVIPYGDGHDILMETPAGLAQLVRERAYLLWEQDGSPDGRADEFWHRAREQHLRERAYRLWEQEGRPDGESARHWQWVIDYEER